jgi:transcription antitermination factor NusA-like protein
LGYYLNNKRQGKMNTMANHLLDESPSNPDRSENTEVAIEGIGKRFQEGFSDFMRRKKRSTVVELLQEEFPHLAQDECFINEVVVRLGEDVTKEKRFVFLVTNPRLKP